MYSFARKTICLEIVSIGLNRRSLSAAAGICCYRLQSRRWGKPIENDFDLFARSFVSIFRLSLSSVGECDHTHGAKAVIEDD